MQSSALDVTLKLSTIAETLIIRSPLSDMVLNMPIQLLRKGRHLEQLGSMALALSLVLYLVLMDAIYRLKRLEALVLRLVRCMLQRRLFDSDMEIRLIKGAGNVDGLEIEELSVPLTNLILYSMLAGLD